MAALGKTFDPTSVDTTQSDFSPLPLGIYKLEVSSSDVVPTKAGTGTILKVSYDVIEPEAYAKRRFFGNINIVNQNATAEQIGQKELASLCRAVGITELSESEDLHFHAFTAKVGLEKPQEGYAQRNRIVRFYFEDEGNVPEPAIDETQPVVAANDNRPAARPVQRQAAANDNAPATGQRRPWGQRAA